MKLSREMKLKVMCWLGVHDWRYIDQSYKLPDIKECRRCGYRPSTARANKEDE